MSVCGDCQRTSLTVKGMSSSLCHKIKFILVLSILCVILSWKFTDFGPEQLVITSFVKCAECELKIKHDYLVPKKRSFVQFLFFQRL